MQDTHKIYIAGPFSTPQEKESLRHMIALIEKHYIGRTHKIYVPMDFKVQGDFQKEDGTWNLPNEEWAKKVYKEDKKQLNDATVVYAMNVGNHKTAGTVWEIGYAIGKNKPVIIYTPEWAKNNDMTLMIMNSINGYINEDGDVLSITPEYLAKFNQK